MNCGKSLSFILFFDVTSGSFVYFRQEKGPDLAIGALHPWCKQAGNHQFQPSMAEFCRGYSHGNDRTRTDRSPSKPAMDYKGDRQRQNPPYWLNLPPII